MDCNSILEPFLLVHFTDHFTTYRSFFFTSFFLSTLLLSVSSTHSLIHSLIQSFSHSVTIQSFGNCFFPLFCVLYYTDTGAIRKVRRS